MHLNLKTKEITFHQAERRTVQDFVDLCSYLDDQMSGKSEDWKNGLHRAMEAASGVQKLMAENNKLQKPAPETTA